jgi:hypothetical protein
MARSAFGLTAANITVDYVCSFLFLRGCSWAPLRPPHCTTMYSQTSDLQAKYVIRENSHRAASDPILKRLESSSLLEIFIYSMNIHH